jgi:hypothetical protein
MSSIISNNKGKQQWIYNTIVTTKTETITLQATRNQPRKYKPRYM